MIFRFANTAKTLMARQRRFTSSVHQPLAFVHQPFGLKVKGKIPKSAGIEDLVTPLWSVNPGLVVVLSGFGAFVAGVGIHIITRSTSINTSLENVMIEEAAAKKA
mmetsp:Transcript_9290/g.20966  ORF Transcript_9290/g.20966 Transcript_9290/m.20966 type:complete len:105 (+) Transcript_9290:127-441(+)|eukprot:CAMPEP_0172312356 /NCGR_PEP_ID=MMETSP1058-20130122/17221_1 /TAXON_ID=83371 /ORGANISM="Detonula confervacea, Strain CCMP 353" /LENGTH=104 /DNA_ID=CAMNT_0013025781 /DNA_START=71 /DNA_END=385 /DNA_ORIENTATION=-